MKTIPLVAALLVLLGAPSARAAETLAPGEPLTREHVAALVEAELRDRGVDLGDARAAAIDVRQPVLPLANPAGRPAEVRLTAFDLDERTGRFGGRLDVRLDTGESAGLALAGSVRRLVEVPVPVRRIDRGAALTDDDLEQQWVPEDTLAQDAVRASTDLVDRETRRALPPGRPVRRIDVAAPRLVARGELVTMVYSSGGLEVSAAGEALDAGGEGDTVRLVNPDSRLVRKGVVVGRKLVRVVGARDGAS